jgi:hypothetical protein
MEPRTMETNAATHYDEFGEYALSVWSLPGADVATIAAAANLPHSVIRVSTARRIRAAGYELVRSEPPPSHVDLKLPNPPTSQDWETIRSIFDEPITNPYRRQG